MKKTLAFGLAATLLISSCGESNNSSSNNDTASEESATTQQVAMEMDEPGPAGDGPSFIHKDSANKMISSYLQSIPASDQNNSLASLIVNADSLRAYLNDTSLHIKHVKIMFAHTLSYINSGHYGQFAGYRIKQLTTVIAGYNADGNYVYWEGGNEVMDYCIPCPNNCPPSGNAQFNTFPVQ